MTIRLLIADDHHLVREGLRALIVEHPEFEVVGEAGTGREAVRLARMLRPDIVLMDLIMPELDGIAATALIREEMPDVQVLILTSVDEPRGVAEAVRAGAIGYLLKDVDANELCHAINAAAQGRVQLSPHAATWLMREIRASERPEALTERETGVLQLLAQGLANKEIARDLGISETTVKSHMRHILSKLGVDSRTQAALEASRRGLVRESSLAAFTGRQSRQLSPSPSMPVSLRGGRSGRR